MDVNIRYTTICSQTLELVLNRKAAVKGAELHKPMLPL